MLLRYFDNLIYFNTHSYLGIILSYIAYMKCGLMRLRYSFDRENKEDHEEAPLQKSLTGQDEQLERDWYDQEEDGRTVDPTQAPFLGDEKLFEKREEQLRKRVNHRREARLKDADRWEEDRLRASGMVRMSRGRNRER